jgi:adenosine deaminase
MTDMAEFITAVPKAELHVHIEGTIEADLLFAIADRNGIQLPYKTAADILAGQSKGKTNPKQNLDSFIDCLDVCRGVLRTGRDYESIAFGYLKRCQSENIVYAEIMFDPQQGQRQGVSLEAQVEGLLSASQAGARDFGVETQWIMNFQRDWPVEEACEILEAAQPYRDRIAGIGLDNPELPDFPKKFAPLFATARKEGYRLTSHCDVNIPNSIEHIRGCIETLGVERIDHGLNAIEDDSVVQHLVDKNIALTGCPTRYAFQSETSADDLAMMTGLLERGVLISLNSDDPAQFGSGWLTQTLIEAQRTGNLSRETMTKFMRNGFLSAWLPSDRNATYLQQFDHFCDVPGQEY